MKLRQIFRTFKAPCISQRLFEISRIQSIFKPIIIKEIFPVNHTVSQAFPSVYLRAYFLINMFHFKLAESDESTASISNFQSTLYFSTVV